MLYSIGHSTLGVQAFLEVAAPIEEIWDIRSHPTSRFQQFQRENLSRILTEAGKGYHWEPRLGGWSEQYLRYAPQVAPYGVDLGPYSRGFFPKSLVAGDLPESTPERPRWTNRGLYDYQFFMLVEDFWEGLRAAINRSRLVSVGLLCAEVLWWRCHRSMVADMVVLLGWDVLHLQPRPTQHSEVIGDRLQRYAEVVLERALSERRIWGGSEHHSL